MQEIVTRSMETHQKLFDEMLEHFNLSAKEIGEAAGISEVTLSRFRRGKADLLTTKFLTILAVLPENAREWYVSHLVGAKPKTNLRSLIAQAPPEEQAEVLHLIADSFAKNQKAENTVETVELPEAV